ncbi:hypothetical protein ILYODFUR_036468 [Ilyodon furcidens]|uniref:Uncharacterized protein n=1 Tax=Ilyodon furcidens TaxID=33524 RepID=A0ABV0VK44_9TELE
MKEERNDSFFFPYLCSALLSCILSSLHPPPFLPCIFSFFLFLPCDLTLFASVILSVIHSLLVSHVFLCVLALCPCVLPPLLLYFLSRSFLSFFPFLGSSLLFF